MNVAYLNIWKRQADTLDALRAANARYYQQPEQPRPTTIKTEGRWQGMIKYFFTRFNEEDTDHQ